MYLASELDEIESRERLKDSKALARRLSIGMRAMFADDMPPQRDRLAVYRPPKAERPGEKSHE